MGERLARAWMDTGRERHWRRAAAEGVTVAVATYFALRQANMPSEARSHVIQVSVSLSVGLVAIPFLEFIWNYARAPLAIENDTLRAELRTRPSASALPDNTPHQLLEALKTPAPVSRDIQAETSRTYIRDTGPEALQRFRDTRWNERDAIVENSYKDRWLKGRAMIHGIVPGGRTITVFLSEPEDPGTFWGSLYVDTSHRSEIEHLQANDIVDFEGQILKVDVAVVGLRMGSIRLVKKAESEDDDWRPVT
jgi:hypothetical protein